VGPGHEDSSQQETKSERDEDEKQANDSEGEPPGRIGGDEKHDHLASGQPLHDNDAMTLQEMKNERPTP